MRDHGPGETLVGRAHELASLRGSVAAARGGAGCVVLVTGDAGIGKSRLLAEVVGTPQGGTPRVVGRPAVGGPTVLTGRAVEGGGAFRPLVEALAPAAPPALAELPELAAYRPVLARLLPAWSGTAAADPGPASLVDPVLVMGEALLQLLAVLATDRGCVLLLDDLHWADRDTLAVLEYVAGRVGSARVAVLAAARSDERASTSLATLSRHPAVTRLALGHLSGADVVELARLRAGDALPPEVDAYLLETSDGSPLLVEEMLAGLVETGSVQRGPDGWQVSGPLVSRVPVTLAALVHQRLARLDPAARAVLDMAAVLGATVEGALLAAASERTDSQVAAGLHQALAAHLLVRVEGAGTLRWRHALTRDAVLATLLPLEQQALARRAADALTADPDGLAGDRLVLAADLYDRGGRRPEAARLLVLAAAEATRAGALTAAEDSLRRAAVLASARPGLAVEVATELVRVLALACRTDEAVAVGDHVLPGLSGAARSRLCLELARATVAAERFDAADGYLRSAGVPDDPRATALAAHIALGVGDAAGAARLAAAAEAEARTAGLPEVVCEALEITGRCTRRSDPAACEAAFTAAERVAAAHGLTPWRIRALSELGAVDMLRRGTTDRLETARALAAEAGMLGTVTVLDLQIGAGAAARDGHVAALPWVERCAEQAALLRLPGARAAALVFVAAGRLFAGHGEDVDPLLAEALAVAPHVVDVQWATCVRGVAAWLAQDEAAAVELLEEALAPLRDSPVASPTPWWGLLALLRTLAGDGGAALAELRSSDVLVQAGNLASVHFAAAVTAARSGDPVRATRLFADGDRALAGMPYWRHLLHCVLAGAAAAEGFGEPATWLREALAFLEDRDEPVLARRCRELMRETGVTVPRQRRAAGAVPAALRALGVTARELEVLRLVVQGLSNPEVAARLYLSPRTVETHVSSLLAKSGATSRGDLAALFAP